MTDLKDINELTRKAYNTVADKYYYLFKDELAEKENDLMLFDSFAASLPKGSIILDAGCGPCAHVAGYISEKGHKVIGIDISERCIEIANAANPLIDFRVMNMVNTTFEDNYFDSIIAYYSIIHLPQQFQRQAFKEFFRILKTDGKLFVAVKKGNEEGIIENFLEEPEEVYFKKFSEEELADIVVDSGFKIENIETRDPYNFEIQDSRIYVIATKRA